MEMVSSKQKFDLEETELRLGLPDHVGKKNNTIFNAHGKRGFSETVDLKLNLNSSKETSMDPKEKQALSCNNDDPVKPPAKAQVVGWPPVRNFRKNILAVQKSNAAVETTDKGGAIGGVLVKVSMDGAPYLRKVDLRMYQSYQELSDALSKMFSLFTTGNSETKGMINFMKESKLMDLLNSSDFVPTYEDKDGDWMLVGDVPWEMFVESCKRLRIMKGAEAAGLAPRAMEKCKNRAEVICRSTIACSFDVCGRGQDV